jgi:hypothetical protein
VEIVAFRRTAPASANKMTENEKLQRLLLIAAGATSLKNKSPDLSIGAEW